ncbi:MAG: phasin family protein [Steroidobacteraceae bacterium]
MATRKSSSTRRPPHTSNAAPAATRSRRASEQPDAARRRSRSTQQELLHGVQQVWLAGMGAIARAQKDGPAAFSDAVFEGLRLLSTSRSTARRMVRDAFESAQETLQSRVGGARGQAQETWGGLESLFQGRVQRAMHQLGMPTADEIRQLTRRVAELNASVERIDARGRPIAPRSKRAGGKQRHAPARASGKRRGGKPATK